MPRLTILSSSKASCRCCCSRLLADRESYGYEVVQSLHQLGLSDISDGTVYPALARLETRVPSQRPSGFVAFGSGPEVLPTHQGRLCGTHRWRVLLARAGRRGHSGVVTPLPLPTS